MADFRPDRRRQLGLELREARQQQQRTLDDLSRELQIRRDYLEALEAGDYGAFPGTFWARLFLRTYAHALGLDPDRMVAAAFPEEEPSRRREPAAVYPTPRPMPGLVAPEPQDEGRGDTAQGYVPRRSRRGARRPRNAANPSGAGGTVALALLAAAVLALLVIAVGPRPVRAPRPSSLASPPTSTPKGHPSGTSSTSPSRGTQSTGGPKGGATQAHPSQPSSPSSPPPAGLRQLAPGTYAVAAGPVTVRLRLGYLSWVKVLVDGRQALWKEEPGGFTATFQGQRQVQVYLGYPQGSVLSVGGARLGPLPGRQPQWITVQVGRAGGGKA
jgi:hypothetical protein